MKKEPHSPKTEWEAAYAELTPVFLAVLKRLARQGYVVSVGQAMDFVHDFFAEAWPGVASRYDPSRASLKVYAAAAFARFVRPRLVREARWRQTLTDWRLEPTSDASPSQAVDVLLTREALARLSSADRALLAMWFGSDALSERSLARRTGASRYRLREAVATALARFCAALGEPGVLSTFEFRVARLLFLEGRSVRATAAELKSTESQVRMACRRILRALGKTSREVSS